MRVWLVTCLILFTLVQFYEWAKGFILPLPIYVLAGAFLSLASNYSKIPSLPNQTMIDDQSTKIQE
ncbi:hypothetical protein [Chroococcus sp. FPU101]|uniref:hypothetical protein n=1 Tax=Chroococcus sp. FPU101 TaxID=1974212 RepID=UPI001A8E8F16|nr:hypothetical protein [Chroococcus sp. FPU101]GFE69813.1 hypothetical protein CFPU101_24230 [Chroococcus sp. FPU101]